MHQKYRENEFIQIRASNYKVLDLRDALHRDFVNITFESPNETTIYLIENERWIEHRDEKLFETIGVLASQLQPFIFQVIPVFEKAFSMHHSDAVYLSSLKALRQFVFAFDAKFRFIASIVIIIALQQSCCCQHTKDHAVHWSMLWLKASNNKRARC